MEEGHSDHCWWSQVSPVEGFPGSGCRAVATLYAPWSTQLWCCPVRASIRTFQEGRRQPSTYSDWQKVSITFDIIFFRHFQNVVDLCIARLRTIRASHRMLYWHHCLEYVYRYLSYHRLWLLNVDQRTIVHILNCSYYWFKYYKSN